jgi:hypothetical protein
MRLFEFISAPVQRSSRQLEQKLWSRGRQIGRLSGRGHGRCQTFSCPGWLLHWPYFLSSVFIDPNVQDCFCRASSNDRVDLNDQINFYRP